MLTGNFDYFFPLTSDFRLFSGVNIGAFKNNMVYGIQGGAIYDISKNIEFEVGANYSKYKKDVKISGKKFGYDYTNSIDIKNSSSFYAGFNFKF